MSKIPGLHKAGDVTLKRGVISADDGSFDFAAAAGETAGTSFFDGRLLTADDLRDEQMADHDVVVDGMIAALEDWQAMMPASGGDLVG